jgi:hypothetical protein
MREWDLSSYQRKFSGTRAFCSIGGKPPEWKSIHSISAEGIVYDYETRTPIGEVISENQIEKFTPAPELEFIYQPIQCGFYLCGKSIVSITRKHVRSWKIGLSNEGYNILRLPKNNMDAGMNVIPWYYNIDLSAPFIGKVDITTTIGNGVAIKNKELSIFNTTIGFVEGNRVVLKNKVFNPILAPYLGDKWQIVNL